MKFSDRKKRPARRKRSEQREQKKRLLVLCEGEITERHYLQGYERFTKRLNLATVQVELPHVEVTDPLSLVQAAVERQKQANLRARKDPYEAYDQVWCVFDIDDHLKVPEAQVLAQKHDIQLAISNPCFELWLLLHFAPNPGLQPRKELAKRLKKHTTKDKEKWVHFSDYQDHVWEAYKRARKMHECCVEDGEEGRNPSTSVFKLIDIICPPELLANENP